MVDEIESAGFSGHRGFVVVRDAGRVGVLDEADEVRELLRDGGTRGRVEAGDTLSEPVAWEDPRLRDARSTFLKLNTETARAGATIKALTSAPKGVRLRDKEADLASVTSLAATAAADGSPRMRSTAHLLRAGVDGSRLKLTGFDLFKLGAIQSWANSAVQSLDAAVKEDPSNALAWCAYGQTALGVFGVASPWRGMAESSVTKALGGSVTLVDVGQRIVENLLRTGTTFEELYVLDLLARVLAHEGRPMPASFATALAEKRAELARLRALPANAAALLDLDTSTADLRGKLR